MRRKKKSENNSFNVWRSYSDMMAGVLLLFVLIMCVTLFQAQKSYNESIQERDDKIALQEEYTQQLLDKQTALDEKEGTIQNQDEQLKSQDEQLKTQQEKLDEQQQQLTALAAKLKEQEATLKSQQSALDTKTAQLKSQQEQIDQIIGVKAEVIEALKNEFSKNNINVDIDAQTGALTLEASVMFDYDQAELTDAGKQALEQILPIYCKVLLQDDYMKYLAEIIIDGYTDTDGDYDYNLELSQKRSLAVAQYLTEIRENFLSSDEMFRIFGYNKSSTYGPSTIPVSNIPRSPGNFNFLQIQLILIPQSRISAILNNIKIPSYSSFLNQDKRSLRISFSIRFRFGSECSNSLE